MNESCCGWDDWEGDAICLSLNVGIVQVCAVAPGVWRLIGVGVPSHNEGWLSCRLDLGPEWDRLPCL